MKPNEGREAGASSSLSGLTGCIITQGSTCRSAGHTTHKKRLRWCRCWCSSSQIPTSTPPSAQQSTKRLGGEWGKVVCLRGALAGPAQMLHAGGGTLAGWPTGQEGGRWQGRVQPATRPVEQGRVQLMPTPDVRRACRRQPPAAAAAGARICWRHRLRASAPVGVLL